MRKNKKATKPKSEISKDTSNSIISNDVIDNKPLADDDDTITKADVINFAVDVYQEYKKGYDACSKSDKRKILAIFLPLAITFVLGFIGVFLANSGQYLGVRNLEIVGFVFMGVGLGGFFLNIILLAIISSISERRETRRRK